MRLKASAQLSLETASPTAGKAPGKEQLIMAENQSFLQELQGRSQEFTFPRRGFLQKAASVASLLVVPRSKTVFEIPQKYPAPQFAVGDQILSFLIDDDEYGDVDERFPSEFGEIMGVCWHPRNEQWEYIINWTGGDCADCKYPIFDEVLIGECDLRLVSHA